MNMLTAFNPFTTYDISKMYVIQNTRLDSKEGAVKIGGRNSNDLKYVDDIILKT